MDVTLCIARGRRLHDVRCDFHNENETVRSWYDGSPQQHVPERDWRSHQLRPGMTVVDCGADQGMLASTVARAVAPGGSVIAYEALPEDAAISERSAVRNGVPNVEVRPEGLGSANATLRKDVDASGTVVLAATDAPAAGQSSIQGVRQDDLLADPCVDMPEVDVEGRYLQALRGTQRMLAQRPILDLERHDA